jgi:hypothetical protein
MPLFSMDVTVLDIKLPQLVWASYLVVGSKFLNLLNFLFSSEEQFVFLAEAINLFMINSNMMIQFQVFMQSFAANAILKIYIITIVFQVLNNPRIRRESAIFID